MRIHWSDLVLGEQGLTAMLSGFSAATLLRRGATDPHPRRRQAASAAGLSTAGLALYTAHGVALAWGAQPSELVSLLVGLPALAGALGLAWLCARK